ncbi:MAG: 4-phosphoerythronate dehydrogenase [Muribaculaceae bacterium]|nr:4-phosphoerythronate dehydrogenase [Muribaculaceae bacterium]
MDIIIESHIPFIKGLLEQRGHRVTYLPPEEITPEAVRDVDTLIIRTRTRACEALLAGSRVRHVITATIGTDHIDRTWCEANGIRISNAPGCNAPAVAQYVIASIAAVKGGLEAMRGLTIGIVGVGHVGSIVEHWATTNGIRVLRNDPPRAAAEGADGFTDLATIAEEADVITFHTPLDATTYHLCGTELLEAVKRRPMIINAARGPVVDTCALIDALRSGRVSAAAIDCWEGEPNVNRELLALAAIATPHVAGYSLEGKQRASAMAAVAAAGSVRAEIPPVAMSPTLSEIIESYDPIADTKALKSAPDDFESLRNCYNYRTEPCDNRHIL